MHANIIKTLSVLSSYGPIGDKFVVEKFFDPLVRLTTNPSTEPGLVVCCAEMLHLLCSKASYETEIQSYLNDKMVFAKTLTLLIQRDLIELQSYVTKCVASLASDKERRSFVVLGGGKKLIQILKKELSRTHGTQLCESSIAALFNLSVCKSNRNHLCRIGLKTLLQLSLIHI